MKNYQRSTNQKENEEKKEYKDNAKNIKKKLDSLSLVKAKINSHTQKSSINRNSDYISARMEKVNFFRNYFYNNKLN